MQIELSEVQLECIKKCVGDCIHNAKNYLNTHRESMATVERAIKPMQELMRHLRTEEKKALIKEPEE